VGADAVKYISEILKRINFTQIAAGDEAVDDTIYRIPTDPRT
jgi:hypothetical protein